MYNKAEKHSICIHFAVHIVKDVYICMWILYSNVSALEGNIFREGKM